MEYLKEIAERAYDYDPNSVDSMVDAATRLCDDYRRDTALYNRVDTTTPHGQWGEAIAKEYAFKAIGMIADLADVPAEPTPAGLPTPEVAARFLAGNYLGHAYSWGRATAMMADHFKTLEVYMDALLNWMVTAGYVAEIRYDGPTGMVMSIRLGRDELHTAELVMAPAWIGEDCRIVREGKERGRFSGQEHLIAHPDTLAVVFAK